MAGDNRIMLAKTVALGLLLGAAGLWGAGDGPLDRATLRGLKALNVIVDPIGPDLARGGLTADALRGRLERALSTSGITFDPQAAEFLALRVTSAQGKRTDVAISVSLSVYQPVILARNKEKTATDTWEIESVILAPPKQVQESVAETVELLVRQFAQSHRSANDVKEK